MTERMMDIEEFPGIISEDDEDTQKDRYLTFVSEGEAYAVEIRHVGEIIGVPPITGLPCMEPYTKGLINLRGQIIPMLDMRLKLAKQAVPYTERTCTVIIYYEQYTVGLIVDAVSDVVHIPPENVIGLPAAKLRSHHRFVQGIGRPEAEKTIQEDEMQEEEIQEEAIEGEANQKVLIVDLGELLRHEKKGDEDDGKN